MTELGDLIRAAADRPSVRVIVLTGAGKASCMGADLAAAAAAGGKVVKHELRTLHGSPGLTPAVIG